MPESLNIFFNFIFLKKKKTQGILEILAGFNKS
jgi:hypothetical protein